MCVYTEISIKPRRRKLRSGKKIIPNYIREVEVFWTCLFSVLNASVMGTSEVQKTP